MYWLVFLWLMLGLAGSSIGVLDYLDDVETYHRVYRDPLLYLAMFTGFVLLHGAALVMHAAGRRACRVRLVAVMVPALFVVFMALQMAGSLFVTCCN